MLIVPECSTCLGPSPGTVIEKKVQKMNTSPRFQSCHRVPRLESPAHTIAALHSQLPPATCRPLHSLPDKMSQLHRLQRQHQLWLCAWLDLLRLSDSSASPPVQLLLPGLGSLPRNFGQLFEFQAWLIPEPSQLLGSSRGRALRTHHHLWAEWRNWPQLQAWGLQKKPFPAPFLWHLHIAEAAVLVPSAICSIVWALLKLGRLGVRSNTETWHGVQLPAVRSLRVPRRQQWIASNHLQKLEDDASSFGSTMNAATSTASLNSRPHVWVWHHPLPCCWRVLRCQPATTHWVCGLLWRTTVPVMYQREPTPRQRMGPVLEKHEMLPQRWSRDLQVHKILHDSFLKKLKILYVQTLLFFFRASCHLFSQLFVWMAKS